MRGSLLGQLADFSLGVLYAISLVSGALGGCAAGFHYWKSVKEAKAAFFVAYVVLGGIWGVITFSGAMVLGVDVGTIHKLILYCVIAGGAGSVALFSANWTVKTVFRKLGVEVEVTLRKSKRGE